MTIAIIVFLFLLGSVLWALPSPREKRLARLRSVAIRKGFHVRLGLPSQDESRWVTYSLDWNRVFEHKPKRFELVIEAVDEGWRVRQCQGKCEQSLAPVLERLDRFIPGYRKVSFSALRLALEWDENLPPEEIEPLLDALLSAWEWCAGHLPAPESS